MLLSLTTTKLLDFLSFLTFTSSRMHAEWTEHHVHFSYKPLLFEQHNKQFGSDFNNLTCPIDSVHTCVYSLSKVLTTLLMASCLRSRSLAVLAWA